MRVIYIFPGGSAAVIDPDDTTHSVTISGQDPSEILPATEENLKRYFGVPEKPEIGLK